MMFYPIPELVRRVEVCMRNSPIEAALSIPIEGIPLHVSHPDIRRQLLICIPPTPPQRTSKVGGRDDRYENYCGRMILSRVSKKRAD